MTPSWMTVNETLTILAPPAAGSKGGIIRNRRNNNEDEEKDDCCCVVELVSGDMSKLATHLSSDDEIADLLVVRASSSSSSSSKTGAGVGDEEVLLSSKKKKTNPLISTLLMQNHIHTINQLTKQEDLRDSLDCWISTPLLRGIQPTSTIDVKEATTTTTSTSLSLQPPFVRQVLVWEPTSSSLSSSSSLGNDNFDSTISAMMMAETIFAAMIAMAKDSCRTVIMSIFDDDIDNDDDDDNNDSQLEEQRAELLKAIVKATRKWVRRGLPIQKLYIVTGFSFDGLVGDHHHDHDHQVIAGGVVDPRLVEVFQMLSGGDLIVASVPQHNKRYDHSTGKEQNEKERMRDTKEKNDKDDVATTTTTTTSSIVLIQCWFRRVLAIQALIRMKKDKKRLKRMSKKSKKAIIKIQALGRGFLQYRKYKTIRLKQLKAAQQQQQQEASITNTTQQKEQEKLKLGGSASVVGDQLAGDKSSSPLTGEVYIRADGKKLRRVKKSTTTGETAGDQVEIITQPDGTKVRRFKRAKKLKEEGQSSSLDSFLGIDESGNKQSAGSPSTPGDMQDNDVSEIYIRADGKKVRRIKKTVAAPTAASDDKYEIYIRPDGKKVRRIKRSAKLKQQQTQQQEEDEDSIVITQQQQQQGKSELFFLEDEAKAALYQKMLKLGMPKDIVAHKMVVEEVSEHIIEFVLGGSNDDDDDDDDTIGGGKSPLKQNHDQQEGPSTKDKERYNHDNANNIDTTTGDVLTSTIFDKIENLNPETMADLVAKLNEAEKRQKKFEKKLSTATGPIMENIDYETCKTKLKEIETRMKEIDTSRNAVHPDPTVQKKLREEYFQLEQAMEKYSTALRLTDEYQVEQEPKWQAAANLEANNAEALQKLRRHMPVNIRTMSEAQLMNEPSPNGKYLPQNFAIKFKRTNILQIIRQSPDDIERMHPTILENMQTTGLTLTEYRAVYEHVKGVGHIWEKKKVSEDETCQRKWEWFKKIHDKFQEALVSWERHVDQYGPPENHPYATPSSATGCPLLGVQCPLKAEQLINYNRNDYGWPDGAEYEVSKVKKADYEDDPGARASMEALELSKKEESGVGCSPIVGELMTNVNDGRGPGGRNLLDTSQGRSVGRGRVGARSGSLLDAIQHSRGRGRGSSRGGLLDSIQGRSGGRGRVGAGRGSLLDIIRAHGRSGGRGRVGGGRDTHLDLIGRGHGGRMEAAPAPSTPAAKPTPKRAEKADSSGDSDSSSGEDSGSKEPFSGSAEASGSEEESPEESTEGSCSAEESQEESGPVQLVSGSAEESGSEEGSQEESGSEELVSGSAEESGSEEDTSQGSSVGRGRAGARRGSLLDAIQRDGGRGDSDSDSEEDSGSKEPFSGSAEASGSESQAGSAEESGAEEGGQEESGSEELVSGSAEESGSEEDTSQDSSVVRGRAGARRGSLLDAIQRDGGRGGGRGDSDSDSEEDSDSDGSSKVKPNSCIVLSFAETDLPVAQLVLKALALFEGKLSIIAKAAKWPTDTMEDDDLRASSLDNASRVIALITPNYVRNLACLDQFNECLLSGRRSLQPVLVKETVLPKYLQVVQFHDARPGRIDKLVHALSTIMYSLKDETKQEIPKPFTGRSLETRTIDDSVLVGPSFDIFISYASKMRAQANAIVEILQHMRRDIKYFVDVNDLHAGARWQQTLYNALDNSRLVLIILTPAFLTSIFCREEAAIAALRTMEGNSKIIAVEAVPVDHSALDTLPIEVVNSMMPDEPLFKACSRALALLDAPRQTEMTIEAWDTRSLLHSAKMKSLEEVNDEWKKGCQEPSSNLRICIVGHQRNSQSLVRMQQRIDSSLGSQNCVTKILTPEDRDLDSMDLASILICVLSEAFLGSGFCLNALNIGILRNRTDGGYLVPIAIELLDPHSTPSFVRLLPTIDASGWDEQEEERRVIQEMLVAAARMSAAKKWNDHTTLIAPRGSVGQR